MELEALGKLITEALAIQGKMSKANKEIESYNRSIEADDKELERLDSLIVSRQKKQEAVAALLKDKAKLKEELDARMKTLDAEGVALPVGEKAVNRQVRL